MGDSFVVFSVAVEGGVVHDSSPVVSGGQDQYIAHAYCVTLCTIHIRSN